MEYIVFGNNAFFLFQDEFEKFTLPKVINIRSGKVDWLEYEDLFNYSKVENIRFFEKPPERAITIPSECKNLLWEIRLGAF